MSIIGASKRSDSGNPMAQSRCARIRASALISVAGVCSGARRWRNMRISSTSPISIAAAAKPAPPIETSWSVDSSAAATSSAAKLAYLFEVDPKLLLARDRPAEPTIAVGDEAVNRDVH